MAHLERECYVLDSYALIAYFEGENGLEQVKELLQTAAQEHCELLMSVINLGEALYIIERERGLAKAQQTMARIDELPIQIVDVDRTHALAAAHLKAQWPVAYADCFAAALAQLKGASRPSAPYLDDFYKPTIAAVNGPAVGAGLGIAVSCDIRIASENAKFGYFYVLRGIIESGAVVLTMLKHIIGLSRAMEMMLSGETMDAAEAERVGLVSRVVPQERLMEEARELARKLMKAAPLAQQAVKQIVHKSMFEPSGLAEFTTILQQTLHGTEDHLEGARAFAEKRTPAYKGR